MTTNILSVATATLLLSGALAAQATPVPYFSDFEATNGGFTGTGDWQWGMPTGFVGNSVSGGYGGAEPTGGYSGSNCWGTILGGLHGVSTTSSLSQTFNFSGSTGTELRFQEWIESGGNAFDTAEVFANGTRVYFSDGNSNTAWRLVTVDLSAYDGMSSVVIDFLFTTTTVVERVGWYVDDVAIGAGVGTFGSGCGSPTVPSIGIQGAPQLGTNMTVTASNAPANSPAVLVFGTSNTTWSGLPLPLDLGQFGFPGCSLLVAGDTFINSATNASGSAGITIPIPNAPVLSGFTGYWQWLIVNPMAASPFYTTPGLATPIQ